MIAELIDKQDNFEIVREQIAAILAAETANQQTLAGAAGEDPDLWKFRVYSERSNPWSQLTEPSADKSPLVNVWFDSSTFDKGASNPVERQKCDAVFNIDCYAQATSQDDGAGGHIAGDEQAALEAQRVVRLVRNILMAGENTYLQMRGIVWSRWPQSIKLFQPQLDNRSVENVVAARLTFAVAFNEFSPQVQGETLELISTKVIRKVDGEIVLLTEDGLILQNENAVPLQLEEGDPAPASTLEADYPH